MQSPPWLNAVHEAGATDQRGTTVTFKPDAQIFNQTLEYNYDTLANRMRELSYLNKGITIKMIDRREKDDKGEFLGETFHSEEGLKEFISFLDATRESIIKDVISIEGEKNGIPVEVAMVYNTSFSENLHSYVNNINTHEGGTHLSGFRRGLTSTLKKYADGSGLLDKLKFEIAGDDFREGLTVAAIPVLFSPKSIASIMPMHKYTLSPCLRLNSLGKSEREAVNLCIKNWNMRDIIEAAWEDRSLLEQESTQNTIRQVIEQLDLGKLRVAEPTENGWQVNEWVKKAVVLYFPIQKMETLHAGPMEFHDKMPLKKDYAAKGIRVVPHAVARQGAYISSGVILMPSYVNIGAYVDEGTMVDTWATVGSCAQIGKNVHLSGGVGIGGVLEPLQAAPVIIEDNAFVGSRCIVVEGVHVETEAVLGANVVLTASTKIIDVTGDQPVEYKGRVPARSVVIPGSYTKTFPAGDYQVPCALIIGKRKESTNKKTSLNDALREHNLAV